MPYIALDFDTEMKAATESSDKENTHALSDGNIDLKEDFNIIFKMEAKHDFKVKDDFQDDFKALKGDFDFRTTSRRRVGRYRSRLSYGRAIEHYRVSRNTTLCATTPTTTAAA